MKLLKSILVFLALSLSVGSATSQNVLLNILTRNSGIAKKGELVFLEVSICNTDPLKAVPVYKLRPQLSIPPEILSIPDSGHILPAGWSITFNSGAVIRLSNGTDKVPANTCRTILIAMRGLAPGGPSTISGNLLFSNAVAPGSVSGPPIENDNPADNTSTSSCKIIY